MHKDSIVYLDLDEDDLPLPKFEDTSSAPSELFGDFNDNNPLRFYSMA